MALLKIEHMQILFYGLLLESCKESRVVPQSGLAYYIYSFARYMLGSQSFSYYTTRARVSRGYARPHALQLASALPVEPSLALGRAFAFKYHGVKAPCLHASYHTLRPGRHVAYQVI